MDQDGREKKDGTSKPRPIPIREVVGEPAPVPARNSDARGGPPTSRAPGMRGQRARPDGPRGKGGARRREGHRRGRPDGARDPSRGEEAQRAPLAPTPLGELPHRTFVHDGREWIVRLCGQTSTGSAIDPGAPVMHLFFYTAEDPSSACGDTLVAGRSLEELPEIRLPELLENARSTSSPNETSG